MGRPIQATVEIAPGQSIANHHVALLAGQGISAWQQEGGEPPFLHGRLEIRRYPEDWGTLSGGGRGKKELFFGSATPNTFGYSPALMAATLNENDPWLADLTALPSGRRRPAWTGCWYQARACLWASRYFGLNFAGETLGQIKTNCNHRQGKVNMP